MHFLFFLFHLLSLHCVFENNKTVIYFSHALDSRAFMAFEVTLGMKRLWQVGRDAGTLMRFSKVDLV